MENRSSGRDGTNMNGEINSVRRFGHNPSYLYRGIKADIPVVTRRPKMIPADAISQEAICLTDLMRTVVEILGVGLSKDAGEDSYNILSASCRENLWPQHPEIVKQLETRLDKYKMEKRSRPIQVILQLYLLSQQLLSDAGFSLAT